MTKTHGSLQFPKHKTMSGQHYSLKIDFVVPHATVQCYYAVTYHMARRVASVVNGTADDESLPHKTRFKIRNTPNSNLKLDDYTH